MGLHRHGGRRRIRVLVGAIVALVLAAAITGVAVRLGSISASSVGAAAKRAVPATSAPGSGFSTQGSFERSSGSSSPEPAPSAQPQSSAAAVPTDSPPGSMPGWKLVYSQDFSGSGLPAGWGAYSGKPGGDPNGQWNPANVVVSGGALHLMATSSSTGGVMFSGNPQTDGMYLVRMKGDYEPGLQISDIALLWPQRNVWPPEIDFYEDKGGARDSYVATVHPGPDGDNSDQVHVTVDSNATQWHTYGVEWTPSSITFTIDGQPVGSSVPDSGLPAWPDIPMNLALQSQNLSGAQPSQSIETMTVDWVAEYALS
jgi:Glycosyl hydrolases family 16